MPVVTSVGPGWNTDWSTDLRTQQTQTVSGLQVALLIVGNFTIKCHAVLEYGGEGGGRRGLPEANVVVGVQMLLLELEVLLHIYCLDILPQSLQRLDINLSYLTYNT